MVIPQGQDHHHPLIKCPAHMLESPQVLKGVGDVECGCLGIAEWVCDGVVCLHTGNVHFGVLDDFSVLYIYAADLR